MTKLPLKVRFFELASKGFFVFLSWFFSYNEVDWGNLIF
jgi:hypothetical protein